VDAASVRHGGHALLRGPRLRVDYVVAAVWEGPDGEADLYDDCDDDDDGSEDVGGANAAHMTKAHTDACLFYVSRSSAVGR
jgi:hypothetical protein